MFARNVSIHLKSNMLSDYTRTFENDVSSFASQAEGLQGRNHIVKSGQPGCYCHQSVGEQSQCRSLQHLHLPRSVENAWENDRWNPQGSDV